VALTQKQMEQEKIMAAEQRARGQAGADDAAAHRSAMVGGALKGGQIGAAIGSAIAPGVGTVLGGAVGGVLGGVAGEMIDKKAQQAEKTQAEFNAAQTAKQQIAQQKETAKLQRQMITTSQQAGRARSAESASTIKQPTMSTPAGEDIGMASMPVATRRGTQYDAWRQQTYPSGS